MYEETIPCPLLHRAQYDMEQFQDAEASLVLKASGSWTFLSEILQTVSSGHVVD